MVDWTELDGLHKEAGKWSIKADAEFATAIHNAFHAILAERREMLAKLEAAEKLLEAPYLDYGGVAVLPDVDGKSWFTAVSDWKAFDKEPE